MTPPDVNKAWPSIEEALASGNTDLARKLLWPADAGQDWYEEMAPKVESVGDGYSKSNRELAIFCYEQSRDLYRAHMSFATSGGEGMAAMSEMRGSHLGRKIWLLKS